MNDFVARIETRDIGIFEKIPSQSTDEDKSSFLFIQNTIREINECYTYLEIGSYMGGTIQPYLTDPKCCKIYSIDKRPQFQPDARGRIFEYPENLTKRMLNELQSSYPDADTGKIATFDADASMVNKKDVDIPPQICLIDGEHNNKAVFSDFRFCFSVCAANGIIILHDANLVLKGIFAIEKFLKKGGVKYKGYVLKSCLFVFLLNGYADKLNESFITQAIDKNQYFSIAKKAIKSERQKSLYVNFKSKIKNLIKR